MADINGVRDSLDMDEAKSSLDKAVEDLLETTEKAMNATSKRQMRKYQKMREQQQKTVEDLMDDFESIFEVTSDGLDDLDKDMYDVFLSNRRKDLKLYDTAYKQQMKKQTKTMKRFFSDAEDGWENLEDKISNIANIVTALNVGEIKDALEGSTVDTVDQLREIKKALNLNDEEMKAMKETIQKSSNSLSDAYGGMISSTDLTSAVNYIVSEVGIRDKELATQFGEELSVFKAATDLDYEAIDELVKTIETYNWDPALISETTNELKKLTSSYEVSGEAITSALEQMNGRNERLAGGDQELYQKLEEDLMMATTMLENSYVDSSKVFDKFNQDIGSFYEDMSWVAAGGADLNKMKQAYDAGDYTTAISEFYKGIQGLEESGLYDSNSEVRRMIQESLDITSSEWERIVANLGKTSVDEMESQMQGLLDSTEDMLSKSINDASYKKWYQKALDKFGLSELGGSITNFIEGLDVDLSDLFVLGSGAKGIWDFAKGKGFSFPNLGKKFGDFFKGADKAAAYSADDLAKAFGTSTDDIISTFGKQASYSIDDIAKAMGTSADDVVGVVGDVSSAVLSSSDEVLTGLSSASKGLKAFSKAAPVIGSVIEGVVGAFQVAEDMSREDYRAASAKTGETVGSIGGGLGGAAGGAAAGAAIGSVVPGLGTAIGGVIGGIIGGLGGSFGGAALGDKAGEAIYDATTGGYSFSDSEIEQITKMYEEVAKLYKDKGNNAAQDYTLDTVVPYLESIGVSESHTDDYKIDVGKPDFMKHFEDGLYGGIDGSHRNGLDYVPYDGYIAELHKGEAVLTSAQNSARRNDEKESYKEVLEYALDENDTTFAEIAVSFADKFVDESLSMLRRNKGLLGMIFGGSGYSISGSGGGSASSVFGGSTSGSFAGTGGEAASTVSGSGAESKIWNFFAGKGLTSAGISGLMGNLYAESGLNSNNLQNSYESKLGYNDSSYTSAVDSGAYSNFVNDSAGYGLAQWTYSSRKQGLIDYARSQGKSISDLDMQLEYLWKELSSNYGSVLNVLKSTNSVQEASDAVLYDFESPANPNSAQRAGYAQNYMNKYGSSYDVGTPWIPNDQVALVHEGEMIVPKKYNPLNSSVATTTVGAGESLEPVTYKSLDNIADILRQGFAYIGKKIDGIRSQSTPTYSGPVSEATSPLYFSSGGIL